MVSRSRAGDLEAPVNDFLCIVRFLMTINLFIAWSNIVLLTHCIATATLIQLIWCFKPTKKGYLFSALIAFVAGVGCLYVGIELLPSFSQTTGRGTTVNRHQLNSLGDDRYDDDDHYDNILGRIIDIEQFDIALEAANAEAPCEYGTTNFLRSMSCDETTVGAVAAFGSAALWFLVIDCILRFVDTTWWEAAQDFRRGNHNRSDRSIYGNDSTSREDLIMRSAIGAEGHDQTDETARLDHSWPEPSHSLDNDDDHSNNRESITNILTITDPNEARESAIFPDEDDDHSNNSGSTAKIISITDTNDAIESAIISDEDGDHSNDRGSTKKSKTITEIIDARERAIASNEVEAANVTTPTDWVEIFNRIA